MDIEELAEFLENFRQCLSCNKWDNSCFPAFDTFDFLDSEVRAEQINNNKMRT